MLKHPHVMAHGADPEQGVLASEVVTSDRLRARGPRNWVLRRLASMFSQVASALAHLHGLGVVHRGLTLRNIVVRPDGTAALVPPTVREIDCESVEAVAWLAPESLARQEFTAASDVFMLGSAMIEAVSGTRPWLGLSLTEVGARSTAWRLR